MKYGYYRITEEESKSFPEHILELRDRANKEYGKIVWLKDVAEAGHKCPNLDAMCRKVVKGDLVILPELKRLTFRSKELMRILTELTDKGVKVVSVADGFDNTDEKGKYLISAYRMMLELPGDKKEFYGEAGKPRTQYDKEKWEELYPVWKRGEITATNFMNLVGLKPMTFYRRVKEYEAQLGAE